MNLDLDDYRKSQFDTLVKKVLDERKQQEIDYHKDRVRKLLQEKLELELRLLVLQETLRQIDEFTKNNPLFKE